VGIAQLACIVPHLPNYLLDLLVVDSHQVGFFAGSHPHIYFDCDVERSVMISPSLSSAIKHYRSR